VSRSWLLGVDIQNTSVQMVIEPAVDLLLVDMTMTATNMCSEDGVTVNSL